MNREPLTGWFQVQVRSHQLLARVMATRGRARVVQSPLGEGSVAGARYAGGVYSGRHGNCVPRAMKTLLAVAAFAFVAANAGEGIVPVQCVRCPSARRSLGTIRRGTWSIQEFAGAAVSKPNSLENWDGGSSVSWNSHAIDVVGDSESTMLSGNTILHANLPKRMWASPLQGAGTQLNAVGSATVIFDFMVTDPVNAMIQSSFSTYGTVAVGGYLGAHAAMYRDGQFVAGWGLENGSASQEMVWEFGPGAWEITVVCGCGTENGSIEPGRSEGSAHGGRDYFGAGARGALAVAGILVLLGLRRRRGS